MEYNFENVIQKPRMKKVTMNPNVNNEVYTITGDGEWEKITFVGDSGAVDHCMTKDAANWIPIMPTKMSKNGINFSAANGTIIKNYGGRKLNGITEDSQSIKMNVNVTETKRNLASFPKIVEEGNEVFLSKKGSWIKNDKGLKIPMRLQRGGIPEFDMWLRKAKANGQYGALNVEGEADINEEKSPFQRLEEWI